MRSEVKGHIKRAGVLVGVPAVLLWANDLVALALPGGFGWLATAVPLVALFAGLIVAAVRHLVPGFAAFSNYRVRFKHEVAAEVFKIVCPTAAYAPLEGIAEVTFDEAGLFNLRGRFKSDDRVRGRIGQTPFEAADVSRSYTTGGKNKRTVVVFRGLFFHLDFNKTLRGITLVDPKAAASTSVGDRSGLTEVTLENPAFEAGFRVFASDEVEARYILTPAIMERILTLQARTERPVHLAFRSNRAFLGVNYGRALFEPAIAASTSLAAIHEMAAHFALAEGIVHELDLNTRIWTKGVDESLLTSAVAVEPDAFDLATKQGNVTPEALWAAAMEASGHGDDEAAEVVMAAPPGTSIQIDRAGSAVTIDYGLGVGFYLALVVWMAAVALALAAVRVIPTALHMGDEIASVHRVAARDSLRLPGGHHVARRVVRRRLPRRSLGIPDVGRARPQGRDCRRRRADLARAPSPAAHLPPATLRQGRAPREGRLRRQDHRVCAPQRNGVADALTGRRAMGGQRDAAGDARDGALTTTARNGKMLAMYRLAAFLITTSVMAAACGGNAPADAGNAAATSPAAAPPSAPADVNALGKDDRTAGTGAEARPGMMVSVHYTGWLYDPSATDTRGTKFDSSKIAASPSSSSSARAMSSPAGMKAWPA